MKGHSLIFNLRLYQAELPLRAQKVSISHRAETGHKTDHNDIDLAEIPSSEQGCVKILSNTTSRFARVARVALIETGVSPEGLGLMNPWGEDAETARLDPASRVPTLEPPSGLPLTESLLIPLWLEKTRPEPSRLGEAAELDRVMSRAGLAMGAIAAMANLATGRMQIDPDKPHAGTSPP